MKRYTIKPLEWVEQHKMKTGQWWLAETPMGAISVCNHIHYGWCFQAPDTHPRAAKSPYDAKLAAEEWYLSRLTAALVEVKEEA